jgi:uracil-DNA glycosylase
VENWRAYAQEPGPTLLPLPHPSWRNNAWIKRNEWFGEEMLPYLRNQVRQRL